jgi:hypothetical protein
MLAAALDAGGEPQQLVFLNAVGRNDLHQFRPALGQRAGLVDHEGVDPFQPLQRFGIADQNSRPRATADPDHDRHRRGEAERTRTGDDQHGDGGNQRKCEAWLRPEHHPGNERQQRRRKHGGHEPARNPVGQLLDRRARALRLRHQIDDPRQHGIAADPLGAQHQAAVLVDGAADQDRAGRFRHRHGLARHHEFIDERMALGDGAVDRDLLAGPHPQEVADRDRIDRDILVAVSADPPRSVRRQPQ